MSELPRLTTRRLVLRVPTPDDAELMARFAVENREHLAPWEPLRDEHYFTVAYWRTALAAALQRVRQQSSLQLVLLAREGKQERPVLGQCTFSSITRGPFQATYLGYGLHHQAVGQGLMEEALRAAISYCFDELELHRIMANYMPTNLRSARLLRRLGFVPEGFARDYLYLAGRWQDHVLTALLNESWQPPEDGQ